MVFFTVHSAVQAFLRVKGFLTKEIMHVVEAFIFNKIILVFLLTHLLWYALTPTISSTSSKTQATPMIIHVYHGIPPELKQNSYHVDLHVMNQPAIL